MAWVKRCNRIYRKVLISMVHSIATEKVTIVISAVVNVNYKTFSTADKQFALITFLDWYMSTKLQSILCLSAFLIQSDKKSFLSVENDNQKESFMSPSCLSHTWSKGRLVYKLAKGFIDIHEEIIYFYVVKFIRFLLFSMPRLKWKTMHQFFCYSIVCLRCKQNN